jgi:hypothetical protein
MTLQDQIRSEIAAAGVRNVTAMATVGRLNDLECALERIASLVDIHETDTLPPTLIEKHVLHIARLALGVAAKETGSPLGEAARRSRDRAGIASPEGLGCHASAPGVWCCDVCGFTTEAANEGEAAALHLNNDPPEPFNYCYGKLVVRPRSEATND